MNTMTLAPLALSLLLAAPAWATEDKDPASGDFWLTTGFATYHFEHDKNLNGRNPGIGVEYQFDKSLAVTAGRFYNSDHQHSNYAGMVYQPWSFHGVRLGAMGGAFNGYPHMRDGGWFLALVPVASFEYKRVGVNLAFVPSYKDRLHGGISLQFKVKLF
jgi:hypothetical protein